MDCAGLVLLCLILLPPRLSFFPLLPRLPFLPPFWLGLALQCIMAMCWIGQRPETLYFKRIIIIKKKTGKLTCARAAALKSPLSFGHVACRIQNSQGPGNPKVSTAGIHKLPTPLWIREKHENSWPIAPTFLFHHLECVINGHFKADTVLHPSSFSTSFTHYLSRKLPSWRAYKRT